jgi:LysM repeat protein
VRQGETLSGIAAKYRTTVSRITQANNIRERDIIRVGQKLKVPLTAAAAAAASRESAPAPKLLAGGKYKVQKGDSLWKIARKVNTDTKKIQQLNGLKDTRLQIGQILEIPQ